MEIVITVLERFKEIQFYYFGGMFLFMVILIAKDEYETRMIVDYLGDDKPSFKRKLTEIQESYLKVRSAYSYVKPTTLKKVKLVKELFYHIEYLSAKDYRMFLLHLVKGREENENIKAKLETRLDKVENNKLDPVLKPYSSKQREEIKSLIAHFNEQFDRGELINRALVNLNEVFSLLEKEELIVKDGEYYKLGGKASERWLGQFCSIFDIKHFKSDCPDTDIFRIKVIANYLNHPVKSELSSSFKGRKWDDTKEYKKIHERIIEILNAQLDNRKK